MAKKPTKTLAKTEYNFSDYKKSKGIEGTVKDEELSWIPLSKAWHDAIKLPGFARGYVNSVRGYSNTGKSTAFYEAIAGAQKIGDLPVIFETEGNFHWNHARDCGMEFTETMGEDGKPKYGGMWGQLRKLMRKVHPETGETMEEHRSHDGSLWGLGLKQYPNLKPLTNLQPTTEGYYEYVPQPKPEPIKVAPGVTQAAVEARRRKILEEKTKQLGRPRSSLVPAPAW